MLGVCVVSSGQEKVACAVVTDRDVATAHSRGELDRVTARGGRKRADGDGASRRWPSLRSGSDGPLRDLAP